MSLNQFILPKPLRTESGVEINGLKLAYTTHGSLDESGTNVVWVFHALTANSDPAEWWYGLVGEGKLIDPENDFIICVNMPGSCYGSFNPLDKNPSGSDSWYHDFPFFTVKDMVNAYRQLRDYLGIRSAKIAIGGSMGGMQAMEWAIDEPDFFKHLILIATNAKHSPWGIAFNSSQRLAIEADQTWKERRADAGLAGLLAARSIALLSYRSYQAYQLTQEDNRAIPEAFRAESYQRYQGEKLVKRFNAFSYYFLSKGMDSHNVMRGRESLESALGQIRSKTLVIGINSDQLFPPSEQKFLSDYIPDARLELIDSNFGHDGFLLEYAQLDPIIRSFLNPKQIKAGMAV